jgi:uncharacterized protein YbcC (UPF0753/DUF2309 family)
MRYCFSTQRFQTLIKTIAKVEIKFAKNTTNGNSRKAGCCNNSVALANKKSNNWEKLDLSGAWLKNAGFIVGSRELTKSNNLDGRCFLHSYNWEKDKSGKALEAIMQGPMGNPVDKQPLLFSTVDNAVLAGV